MEVFPCAIIGSGNIGLRVSMPKRSMRRVAQFDTLAPAPHQDRRPRRRDEDDDPSALAYVLPRAGYPALRSRTHTAPRHLTDGPPTTAEPPKRCIKRAN